MAEIRPACEAWIQNIRASGRIVGLALTYSLYSPELVDDQRRDISAWIMSTVDRENPYQYVMLAQRLGASAEYPQYMIKLHEQIKDYFYRGTISIACDPNSNDAQKVVDVDLLHKVCMRWSTTICPLCGDLGHQVSTCAQVTQPKASARSIGQQTKTLITTVHKVWVSNIAQEQR